MSDPINPDHYAGRACADIGERLSANGYQILKYVWRLGKKDTVGVELGKAIWYGNSEIALMQTVDRAFPGMHTMPLTQDLTDPRSFLFDRLEGQPSFTRSIAQLLWQGNNADSMRCVVTLLEAERILRAST